MSVQPGLHSTNMVNQSVTLESDLGNLVQSIPDGTLVYARDTATLWLFNPTSTAGLLPGQSRPANGGGAFLVVANLSALGAAIQYFDTEQAGGAGEVGLKDVTPTGKMGAIVGGENTAGDSLAGDAWFWNPISVSADDGINVIQPTSAPVAGRWIRIGNQFIGYAAVNINMLSPILFLNNIAAFAMRMHDSTGANPGRNVIIAAGGTAVAGQIGGHLDLTAGDGGAGAADGSVRFFFQGTEALVGNQGIRFTLAGDLIIETPAGAGITGKTDWLSTGFQLLNPTQTVTILDTENANNRIVLNGVVATVLAGTDGVKIVGVANATTVPTVNPVGGGVLYPTGGAYTYRGSGGTVTTLAPA